MRTIVRLSWVLGMILVLGSPVAVQAALAHDSLLNRIYIIPDLTQSFR
jgi:hypothetical protein